MDAAPSAGLPEKPREIDLSKTFNAIVAWIKDLAVRENTPGLIVGISGTDSILTFLACAKAFEELGKPNRVLGVHFGPQPDGETPANGVKPQPRTLNQQRAADDGDWVAEEILPWLRQQAPGAQIAIDSTIDYFDDYQRWATMFSHSLNQKFNTSCSIKTLPPGDNYWIVGTRTRSEDELNTYSNISMAVSLQPIIHLWKSEVLAICEYLGVPEIALEKSRHADCSCLRIELAAENIPEIDWLLMARKGELSPEFPKRNIAPETLEKLEAFVKKQTETDFKKRIPHKPPSSVVS